MIGEEKGSVAISGRSSHKMTGLYLNDFAEFGKLATIQTYHE